MNQPGDSKEYLMIRDRSQEIAYRILATNMPATFMERHRKKGEPVMTARAIKLRDAIAKALVRAAEMGPSAFR